MRMEVKMVTRRRDKGRKKTRMRLAVLGGPALATTRLRRRPGQRRRGGGRGSGNCGEERGREDFWRGKWRWSWKGWWGRGEVERKEEVSVIVIPSLHSKGEMEEPLPRRRKGLNKLDY